MLNFRENETIEFKKSTSELKEGIISIVSILNKHQHGVLYFGIRDDGFVLGQQIGPRTLREISEAISNGIEPKIFPTISNVKLEDKDCILVEFSGDDLPYLANGRAYIRVSDEDKKLTVAQMRKILYKKTTENVYWDSLVSDKTVDDVNEEVLKRYIFNANEAKRIPFTYTNKKDVLNKLGLLEGNRLLNAGKVLFCDDSKVDIQMAIFATDTKTTFIDIDRVSGNIFDLMKAGQEYIRKNIIWKVKITNKREETPEIPLDSIREAITNSFAHKSYLDPKGVEISIFKDRVEIYNPGTFPDEYEPIDYVNDKAHSVLRNPLIASTLYKSVDMESYSSGIKRMYNECKENNCKISFRKEKIGFVVIFEREHEEDNKETKTRIILTEVQQSILNEIRQNNRITQVELADKLNLNSKAVERAIKYLKENNILERTGSRRNGVWIVDENNILNN